MVNELPHLAALYLLLALVLAWVQGDLQDAPGLVLVLAGATLLAHLELARRGLAAEAAVRRGLARAGIPLEDRPVGRRLRPLLWPFPVRPRGVLRLRGLAYGEHRRQRLDVHTLGHRRAPGPVLVHLHGGGYFSGGRNREARALMHHLAARGWVCVSAGYRLRPDAGFSEHLADARAVVAWVHAHAAEHGADTGTLVMAGSSAGAHLSALCALTQHEQSDPATSRVDAVVGLYGYYGRYYGRGPDEDPVSSPLHLDAGHAPPFLLVHGDHDSYVPVEMARAFDHHLRSQSRRDVVYVELPGAQHGFDLFRSWRFTAVVDGVEAFLALSSSYGDESEHDSRGNRRHR